MADYFSKHHPPIHHQEYDFISEIPQVDKRNIRGGYYTIEKRYSSKMYASIFKVAYEYKNVVGVFPLPSHLKQMSSVSFKVAKWLFV